MSGIDLVNEATFGNSDGILPKQWLYPSHSVPIIGMGPFKLSIFLIRDIVIFIWEL